MAEFPIDPGNPYVAPYQAIWTTGVGRDGNRNEWATVTLRSGPATFTLMLSRGDLTKLTQDLRELIGKMSPLILATPKVDITNLLNGENRG
jgi:hypothetical protein